MRKRISLKTRRPDRSCAEFRDYYEHNHLPLGMSYIDTFQWRKYVRNYVNSTEGSVIWFDGITEFWVDNDLTDAGLQQFMRSPDFRRLDEDDRRFLDVSRRLSFEMRETVLDDGDASDAAAKYLLIWQSGEAQDPRAIAAHVLASVAGRIARAVLDEAIDPLPASAPFDTMLTLWISDAAPLLVRPALEGRRWTLIRVDAVETPAAELAAARANPKFFIKETLQMSVPSLEELAAKVQRLLDIEEIKRLKYRYFRCFDMADVAGIAEVFHPDVTLSVVGGVYRFKLEGREKYLEMVREGAHAEMITQHNGHHPEIDVISDTEARGIWYLQDNVWEFRRKMHITGTALYRERYLKVDGRWLIKDIEFERIFEISETITQVPNVTFSYLATHGVKLPEGELPPFAKE